MPVIKIETNRGHKIGQFNPHTLGWPSDTFARVRVTQAMWDMIDEAVKIEERENASSVRTDRKP